MSSRERWEPSIPDLVAIAAGLLLALAASTALTQSDGDLFAHVAFGREIVAERRLPAAPMIGLAAVPTPFVAPAWGAAVVLALLDRIGGLAFVAAFTAVLAGLTHGALAAFLRQRGVEPLAVVLASLLGFVLVSSHWLARPHAFSLAASALLLILLEGGTPRSLAAIPLLFVVWANTHGAWVFGLVLMVAYALGVAGEKWYGSADHENARKPGPIVGISVLALLATLVNPYGIGLHRAVLRSLMDSSIGRVIDEYQPPSIRNTTDLVFLTTVAVVVVAMVRIRRRPPLPWLFIMVVSTAFALRAGRNISLFGVTAWPLIVVHLAAHKKRGFLPSSLAGQLRAYDEGLRSGPWGGVVLTALLLVAAFGGTIGRLTIVDGNVAVERFPVEAVRRLREDGAKGTMLTTWVWSGYVPYAWRGRRTFFDPLVFTRATLASFGTMLLARPGWRQELDNNRIELVMAPRSTPLVDSLIATEAWKVTYEDSTAVVLTQSAPTNGGGER